MCFFRAGLAQEVPSKLKIPELFGQLEKHRGFLQNSLKEIMIGPTQTTNP
jgi:hypothetical protein